MNTIGRLFRLTTFGESHGVAMGGVIDGMPAGVAIDLNEVQRALARRMTAQTPAQSQRREPDTLEVLSGIHEGVTLGTPIGFIIRNRDCRGDDYDEVARAYRPSHADYTWEAKYGVRDPRGGGRASARETVCRVVAGAFAMQVLRRIGITITAMPHVAGELSLDEAAEKARGEGDTIGGWVTCVIDGVPAGLGEPVYGKLSAQLAAAMMSINAAKAFEIGDGVDFAHSRGSEVLDTFVVRDGRVRTLTNHSGGIQGGISNGEPIVMRVTFKPIPTLMRDVETIDRDGNAVTLHGKGRHDVCVLPRVVPVVEVMAAIVVLDNYLLSKTDRL